MFQGCRSFFLLSLGEPFPIALLKIRYQSEVNTITADSNGQNTRLYISGSAISYGVRCISVSGGVSRLMSRVCALCVASILHTESRTLASITRLVLSHDLCI